MSHKQIENNVSTAGEELSAPLNGDEGSDGASASQTQLFNHTVDEIKNERLFALDQEGGKTNSVNEDDNKTRDPDLTGSDKQNQKDLLTNEIDNDVNSAGNNVKSPDDAQNITDNVIQLVKPDDDLLIASPSENENSIHYIGHGNAQDTFAAEPLRPIDLIALNQITSGQSDMNEERQVMDILTSLARGGIG